MDDTRLAPLSLQEGEPTKDIPHLWAQIVIDLAHRLRAGTTASEACAGGENSAPRPYRLHAPKTRTQEQEGSS
jgi:hypothetical protein